MHYRCRLGSLGNSSTASENSIPGDGSPELQRSVRPSVLPSVFTVLFLHFSSFFVLCHSCCYHSHVYGSTLLHAFHISYSHAEWYFIFSRGEMVLWPKLRLSKLEL